MQTKSSKQRRRKAFSVGSIPTVTQTTATPISPMQVQSNRLSILSTEVDYRRRSSESDIAVHQAELLANDQTKYNLAPIQPDLAGLDMARWLCCQARMSIKEEAEELVLQPEKAILKSSEGHRVMHTPGYLRPLILKECLPEYHGPETGEGDKIVPNYVVRSSDYFCAEIVGDRSTRHRQYRVKYTDEPDMLEAAHRIDIKRQDGHRTKARDSGTFKRPMSKKNVGTRGMNQCADISKVVVLHIPGGGYIQGLEFFDNRGSSVADWKQWANATEVPEGVVETNLIKPDDGSQWRFAGLGTEWDAMGWGCFGGQVLSRVAAVWKRI
ncbi:MAG: hypothetical protein MMC23_010024 [Stictis urceolatum]|nr:hypothetical protein [Stictis urceolata]